VGAEVISLEFMQTLNQPLHWLDFPNNDENTIYTYNLHCIALLDYSLLDQRILIREQKSRAAAKRGISNLQSVINTQLENTEPIF
jgi:hypothetical protein